MSLDAMSLALIEPHLQDAFLLCLGYPDMPDGRDTFTYFEERGVEVVNVVDVIAHKGCERIVDLNEPQEWPTKYNMVINPGTLEHCFNIGQAWTNAWNAVAVGGHLMHIAPVTMLNHGFWNICPTAVYEWCLANGGEVAAMRFAGNYTGNEVNIQRITSSASGRGQLPPETVMYALMKKLKDVPARWPAQAVYR